MKLKKNKGTVFWITGYAGSGKSSIAKKLFPSIKKKFGPTIKFSGDELRRIFNLRGYSKKERLKIGLSYHNLCKQISSAGINVLIDVVCLFEKIRKLNRLYFDQYIEIYINADFKKILKNKKKYFYKKNHKHVWGKDLIAELPKNSNIIVNNNFDRSII